MNWTLRDHGKITGEGGGGGGWAHKQDADDECLCACGWARRGRTEQMEGLSRGTGRECREGWSAGQEESEGRSESIGSSGIWTWYVSCSLLSLAASWLARQPAGRPPERNQPNSQLIEWAVSLARTWPTNSHRLVSSIWENCSLAVVVVALEHPRSFSLSASSRSHRLPVRVCVCVCVCVWMPLPNIQIVSKVMLRILSATSVMSL